MIFHSEILEKKMSIDLRCQSRIEAEKTEYFDSKTHGINFTCESIEKGSVFTKFKVTLTNTGKTDFSGIIQIKALAEKTEPKVFMPGYIYNTNTADFPSSGRKKFPRLKENSNTLPESPFFMTRSDRLAEPVSLVYDKGHIWGVAAAPYFADKNGYPRFNGFSCNIDDSGLASAGFTLGYENAPWLFVQTATVLEREPVTDANSFKLPKGESFSFELYVYDYTGESELDIHKAIVHAYETYYEAPRKIDGMTEKKAVERLSSAIRDYAWLEDEQMYTGFVYDKPEGFTYNKIGSLTWTNGLSVALPMLLAANKLNDEKARKQALAFMQQIVVKAFNPDSGFLYDAVENGKWTEKGWWYNGMHSGGHSSYLNGQAVYYLLKAYISEKEKGVLHEDFIELCAKVIGKMNQVLNTDFEYPFSMSVKTGAGLEYDSLGGAWCLAATLLYEKITGDTKYLEQAQKSEQHYYDQFIAKLEGYGGPLDTDKAVDSEGVLGYIRAVRILHEITNKDYLLQHLKDAIYYEATFKLGYNTPVQVPPLSEIGWSSCGGSITSVANPHIHPMSSTIVDDMNYCFEKTGDLYIKQRMEDTVGWSMQTFNTFDKEYGYGKTGWMSERFCFCQGLLTEKYADGKPASTWFALMPWASGSLIEGLVSRF